MTVKKNIPCSLYDIQGMQDWLDEMALQGLFFDCFSYQNDYANFLVDTPRPVRYRLDPVGKNKEKDEERREPYAQMGWEFVDTLPKMYYVFSCGNPDAPELHSDPAVLAYALHNTIRKQIRSQALFFLSMLLLMAVPTLMAWKDLRQEFFLLENPRPLIQFVMVCSILILSALIGALQIRRLLQTRRALEQGLSPKAGRRWPRPRWVVVYILCCLLPCNILPWIIAPDVRWQAYGLDETELSHAWPTPVQLEETGPMPLEMEPHTDGYLTKNSSWFAPVQEFSSTSYWVRFPGETLSGPSDRWVGVGYIRARSPWAAGSGDPFSGKTYQI